MTDIEAGSVDTKVGDTWISGGWIETNTGRRFYPLNPRAEDVDIVDIAHALAYQCRYGGHARFHYSVVQHSVLLADYAFKALPTWPSDCAEHDGLIMLMHDCAEAYLSDMPRPIKYVMPQYLEIEKRLEEFLFPLFGLPYPLPAWAKALDSRIINDERPKLMTHNNNPWSTDGLEPLGVKIRRWSPRRAKWEFLRRFFMWHDGMTLTQGCLKGMAFCFILLALPACAGELADCIYDRELEYATNSEPASWLSGIHAFALMMKVCIGDRDPTGVELSEIQDGMNRALAKAVELSKDRGEGT